MAWLSDEMIEKAPMSCRMSSAAMVSLRMRLSAKAMSSGIDGDQMMADHQHVEMLGERVDGVGPRRIGRGRDDVRQAADLDDVRRMAAAGALGVEGVDGAALDGARSCPRRSRISFSVSVWIITCTSYSSATERQQSMAPGVVPQSSCSFSAQAPASTISSSAAGSEALPLPAKARFIGKASAASIMRAMCQGPGVQVVASVPCAGPVPPPSMVVTPRHQRLVDLLRADEVDMRCRCRRR